jgi:hypothetical protein
MINILFAKDKGGDRLGKVDGILVLRQYAGPTRTILSSESGLVLQVHGHRQRGYFGKCDRIYR